MPWRFENYLVWNTNNDFKIELTKVERKHYSMMEFCAQLIDLNRVVLSMVGAGIGGGFSKAELHVMTYDHAMASPEKEEYRT
jgi:hypothetical protein